MKTQRAVRWAVCVAAVVVVQSTLYSWDEPKHPLENLHIRCIAPDSEYVWFGSREVGSNHHGVFRYHKLTDSWETFCRAAGLPHNGILNIKISPDSVMVHTQEAWLVYHEPSGEWSRLKGYKHKDSPARKQLSVGQYTYRIKDLALMRTSETDTASFTPPDTMAIIHQKAGNYGLRRIFHDNGGLWFGLVVESAIGDWLGRGILHFDLTTETWSHFLPGSMKFENISSTVSDGNFLWFGTALCREGHCSGVGAFRFDRRTGAWRQLSTENSGIAGDAVFAIAPDGKEIWFGTNRGISRCDRSTEKWRTYAITDWECVGSPFDIYAGGSTWEQNESAIIGQLEVGQKPTLLSKRYEWYEIELDKPIPGWIPRNQILIKEDSIGNAYGTLRLRAGRHLKWDDYVKTGPGNQYPNLCWVMTIRTPFALQREQDGWQEILLSTGWVREENVKVLIGEVP